MDFFLGTQERVRNSRGKRAIIVRATKLLLYFGLLLIGSGLPVTQQLLYEGLDKSLSGVEHAYIRKCLALPRSLKLRCRDVIRKISSEVSSINLSNSPKCQGESKTLYYLMTSYCLTTTAYQCFPEKQISKLDNH